MRIRITEKRTRAYRKPISSQEDFSGMAETPGKGLWNYLAEVLAVLAAIGIAVFAFAFFLLVALPILLICSAVFLWKHRRALSAGLGFLRRRRQTMSARNPFARADRGDDVIDV